MSEMIYAAQFVGTKLPCVASSILDFFSGVQAFIFGCLVRF